MLLVHFCVIVRLVRQLWAMLHREQRRPNISEHMQRLLGLDIVVLHNDCCANNSYPKHCTSSDVYLRDVWSVLLVQFIVIVRLVRQLWAMLHR